MSEDDQSHICFPSEQYSAPSSRAFAFSDERFAGIRFCPWQDCWLLPILSRDNLAEMQDDSAQRVKRNIADESSDQELRDSLAIEGEWRLRRGEHLD